MSLPRIVEQYAEFTPNISPEALLEQINSSNTPSALFEYFPRIEYVPFWLIVAAVFIFICLIALAILFFDYFSKDDLNDL